MPRCVWFTPGADRQTPAPTRMLPSVIGGRHAVLRLGIFRSMNQLVSWNRRRFPLGHGPFANDTFCKTTGELATLRKRHGIQCATMGTKEGTSRRDFPCQRHGTPPFVQSKLYAWQRVRSRTKLDPARACCRASSAGQVEVYDSFNDFVGPCEHRRRNSEIKCSGGLQIDDEFKFRGLFYGQVRRVGAVQYPIDIDGRSTK